MPRCAQPTTARSAPAVWYWYLILVLFTVQLQNILRACETHRLLFVYVTIPGQAVVLLLVILLFLLVKKAKQPISVRYTSCGASFIIYRKVSTMDVREKAHPLHNDFPREAAYSHRFTLPAAHMYFHKWKVRLSRCVYKTLGHFWTCQRKWKLTAPPIWHQVGMGFNCHFFKSHP